MSKNNDNNNNNKILSSHQKSNSETSKMKILNINNNNKEIKKEEKKLKKFPSILNRKKKEEKLEEEENNILNSPTRKNNNVLFSENKLIGGLMSAINTESKKNLKKGKSKSSIFGNHNYDEYNRNSPNQNRKYVASKKIKFEGKQLKTFNFENINNDEIAQQDLMFKLKQDLNNYLAQSEQWSESDKNKFLKFKEKIDVLHVGDISKYIGEMVGMNEQLEDMKEIKEMEKRINFFKDKLVDQIYYNNNKRIFLENKIQWKDNVF